MRVQRSQTQRNRYTATISVAKKAGKDYKKILGEMRSYKRGSIAITQTASELKIVIEAIDPVAMRASVNAVLRDLQIVNDVDQIR